MTLLYLPESANGQLAQLTANLQAASPVYDVIDMDVVWTAQFASAGAEKGLDFLVNGLRDGWIPKASLTYEEESSKADFESGKLLFLNNWPFVWNDVSQPGSPFGRCPATPSPRWPLSSPRSSGTVSANPGETAALVPNLLYPLIYRLLTAIEWCYMSEKRPTYWRTGASAGEHNDNMSAFLRSGNSILTSAARMMGGWWNRFHWNRFHDNVVWSS